MYKLGKRQWPSCRYNQRNQCTGSIDYKLLYTCILMDGHEQLTSPVIKMDSNSCWNFKFNVAQQSFFT